MNRNVFSIPLMSLIALIFLSCSNDDATSETIIGVEDLPPTAQGFISSYFSDADYLKVEKKAVADSDGTLYEVDLNNDFEIDFNSDGNWISVDGNNQELPEGIVPDQIAAYVAEYYTGQFITGADKDTNGYEIDLSDDRELIFDTEGSFVREDH